MFNDNTQEIIHALETDGIVYGHATACVNVLAQTAALATPEKLIQMAARRVSAEGNEITAEHVASSLHTTLKAADVTVKELLALEQHLVGKSPH